MVVGLVLISFCGAIFGAAIGVAWQGWIGALLGFFIGGNAALALGVLNTYLRGNRFEDDELEQPTGPDLARALRTFGRANERHAGQDRRACEDEKRRRRVG